MNRPTAAAVFVLLTAAANGIAAGASSHEGPKPMHELETLDPAMAARDAGGEWLWYDVRDLTIEGKGWSDTEAFFHRLPARAKGVVTDPVWSLSTHSAGIAVRFITDSPRIAARWSLTSERLDMPHMPATGVSGLDLYVKDSGQWRWLGCGRATAYPQNETLLADNIPEGPHEYALYLPLYNGVESVAIGILPESTVAQAPARPAPICFYGTSIVQGGCASRPGMAYPAILGRRLDRPVINLGFSGNGKMDPELGDLLAELDAAAYVIDCVPNMTPDMVGERAEPLVTALRNAHPGTPIVLVENIAYQAGAFLPSTRERYESKNRVLRDVHDRLIAAGLTNLHYVPGEPLLGSDGDATVDGTHPTDLGFHRIADALEPVLRRALGKKEGQ